MQGDITRIIQCMLYCKGYDPGELDAIFGSSTENAVKSFQRNNGLAADGIVRKSYFFKIVCLNSHNMI